METLYHFGRTMIFIGILCLVIWLICLSAFLFLKPKKNRAKQQQANDLIMNVTDEMDRMIIPDVFDEKRIRADLVKYSDNKTNLSAYLRGLSLRFQADEQIKSIKKMAELLNVGREYLDAIYNVQKSQSKMARRDLEEGVEKKRLEVEMVELAAKEAELKAKITQVSPNRQRNGVNETKKKWDAAKEEALHKQDIQAEILERTMAIRARLIKKAREIYPEKTEEEIENLVDRQMVDSGLISDTE